MFAILRGIRVAAIAVTVSDFSITPVDNDFNVFSSCSRFCLVDRFSLCVVNRRYTLSTFAPNRPTVVVWNYM